MSSLFRDVGLELDLPRGAVFRAGQHRGDDVIVLNAIGMPVDVASRLASALAEERRITCINTRPARRDGAALAADDASQLTDLRRLRGGSAQRGPIALIGWCTGAHLALRYAAERPQDVSAVVLLNGAYLLGDRFTPTAHEQRYRELFTQVLRNPRAAEFVARGMHGRIVDPESSTAVGEIAGSELAAIQEWTSGPFLSAHTLLDYARRMFAFWQDDTRSLLPQVRCPVLVVSGECDQIVSPLASKHVAAKVARAELDLSSRGTHYRLYDDPALLVRIREFVAAARHRS